MVHEKQGRCYGISEPISIECNHINLLIIILDINTTIFQNYKAEMCL